MSEGDSNGPRTGGKRIAPNKPYPAFPLFLHATGRRAKKIRGKFHYFGLWANPDGALKKCSGQKDALHAGAETARGDGRHHGE